MIPACNIGIHGANISFIHKAHIYGNAYTSYSVPFEACVHKYFMSSMELHDWVTLFDV